MLDGHPVIGETPTRTSVKRDRADHVLQVSKAGYKNASKTIRFDRTPELSAALTLEALPPPPPPPPAKEEPAKTEPKVEAKSEPKAEAKPAEEAPKGKKSKASKAEKKAKAKAKGKKGKKGKKKKG
jgi:hypothetical protein